MCVLVCVCVLACECVGEWVFETLLPTVLHTAELQHRLCARVAVTAVRRVDLRACTSHCRQLRKRRTTNSTYNVDSERSRRVVCV